MKSSDEIRRVFLDYFKGKGHEIVASSPLVPANDPTLLFTNAGMVQFKEFFLGLEKRSYQRAVSSQRCVRAGGKHNDLENVGYTARHHTLFEMLGNFSFGDYFKAEAIHYAWDFLTRVLGLPARKLWVTVYEQDEEAAAIWLNEIGVAESRFSRCGEQDNFWAMGETGPCGPCSEIFYDHGEGIAGGPPGSAEQDGERYVEIWNLVFMQYERDQSGNLSPIPQPSVDTGMGLERIAAVMQGVHDNYDIDSFQYLLNAIKELAGKEQLDRVSARVVADHIRACAVLIADGVLPGNVGRGYVLRRIIRRAARHGHRLGFSEPFFYRLVEPLTALMGAAFPELESAKAFIETSLQQEEERFAETLALGLKHLEDLVAALPDKTIAGEDVFKLYDTYGFPLDLTADIARERGLKIDQAGFDAAMAAQREHARAASSFAPDLPTADHDVALRSDFSGYRQLEDKGIVSAVLKDGKTYKELTQGERGGVILDTTPFYAEAGGQVGDRGQLLADGVVFEVVDTQRQGKAHVHLGEVIRGSIRPGQALTAKVDARCRSAIVRNHSATHLLHAALRRVLGAHVSQQGSLVAPERLRFDFSHPAPLSEQELQELETIVNRVILDNQATQIAEMSLDAAIAAGALSLFGEKYEEQVRVLRIGGDFSVELCGGVHVQRSGDIGLFKIIAESGIAAGVRRIEALTGTVALQWIGENEARLDQLARLLKTDRDSALPRLEALLERSRQLEKEVERLKSRLASRAGHDLAADSVDVAGVKVLAGAVEGADVKTLREMVDQLKNKLGTAAVVLATVQDAKVNLIAGVTRDRTAQLKAGELVNFVAAKVGGKGGGRADMAQAGGNDPAALPAALAAVPEWVRQRLT